MTVAALFVDGSGPYMEDSRFDPWPQERDARAYPGGKPTVAHPPCGRWTVLVHSQPYMVFGDDGGCFHVALWAVRTDGGVLEHPAGSAAWEWFNLPVPPAKGWSQPDTYGGRSCRVDQGVYGHDLNKPTWLYAVIPEYPALKWGRSTDGMTVSGTSSSDKRRIWTPPAFKDSLHDMAASCHGWKPKRGRRQAILAGGDSPALREAEQETERDA